MKIGELAQRTGLAASRIRFYESIGLLKLVQRQANGYRSYPEEAVLVLNLITTAQQAGFSADDAEQVVRLLNALAVDLVELSGGSYEAPAMQGEARDGRTLAREAYFLEFAREIRAVAQMPLMVTGGIRRQPVAEQVLAGGIEMVGIGTALAIEPNLPRDWQRGQASAPQLPPITWGNKLLASLANMAVVKYQLRKLSLGRATQPAVSPLWALLRQQLSDALRTRRYRRWMARRGLVNG